MLNARGVADVELENALLATVEIVSLNRNCAKYTFEYVEESPVQPNSKKLNKKMAMIMEMP